MWSPANGTDNIRSLPKIYLNQRIVGTALAAVLGMMWASRPTLQNKTYISTVGAIHESPEYNPPSYEQRLAFLAEGGGLALAETERVNSRCLCY